MAEGFSQRISLEGAQEILRQLEAIGKGGTAAFKELQAAITSTNPALQGLSAASRSAQTAVAGLAAAVSSTTTLIAPFNSSLAGLLTTFTNFASLGPLAAIGGLVAFVKSSADNIAQLDRTAKALGLTIQQYQGLSKAVKIAGISNEELNTGLTRFSGTVAAAAGEQFKGLIDLAKKFTESFSAGAKIRIVNVDQTLEDMRNLSAAISEVSPQLKALFQDAKIPLGNVPLGQFEQTLGRIASRTDAAGAEMRKLIQEATNFVTAITPFEKFDNLLVKSQAGVKSLGVSFLGINGQFIGTFDALSKVSAELAKLPDGFLKVAIEAKLAGRGVGPELFAALIEARGNTEDLALALKKLGFAFDETLIPKAKEARAAFVELEAAGSKAGNEILSAFGPLVSAALRSLADEIKKIRALFSGDFFSDMEAASKEAGEKSGNAFGAGMASAIKASGIRDAIDFIKNLFKGRGEGGGEAPETGDEGGVFGPLDPVRAIKGVEQLKNGVGILRLGLTEANQAARDLAQTVTTGLDAGKAATDRLAGGVRNVNAALELLKKPLRELTDIQFTELFNFAGGGQERAGRDFAVNPFIADLERAAAAMQAFKDKLEQTQGGGGGGAGGGGSAQLQRIGEDATTAKTKVADLGDTTSQLASTFASIPSAPFDPVTASADGAKISVASVGTTFQEVGALLSGPVEGGGEGVKVVFTEIGNEAEQTLATTRELAAALQQAASIDVSTGGDGGSVGAASGGYIRGPGTGTSDSILARLSHGEYVIRAAAVKHWGASFFAALNALRTPTFALGGYVDGLTETLASSLVLPRFAGGGMVSGGGGALHPVVLSINGGQVIHVRATSSAVEQMRRAASDAQVASTGTKPDWYR